MYLPALHTLSLALLVHIQSVVRLRSATQFVIWRADEVGGILYNIMYRLQEPTQN